MDLEAVRDHCLAKPAVTEGFPFGPDVLVFKVAGKMFALLALEAVPPSTNLKCDPDRAVELRAEYDTIQPGYHMSKKHWNTVILDGSVPPDLIAELVDHSFDLVVASLTKKVRREHGLEA